MPNLDRLKILLVEDHDAHASTLIAILEAIGIRHIDRAGGVEAAVGFLKTGLLYDLMLCDFNLAGINGLSLVRMIRSNTQLTNRYMPIVMITGDTTPERIIAGREAGVNNFLAKPIHPPTLLRAIETILKNPRAFIETSAYFRPDRRRRHGAGQQARREGDRGKADPDPADPWD